MKLYKISRALKVILFWFLISVLFKTVGAVPAQIPLDIGVSLVRPNIMVLLDNSGSMDSSSGLSETTEVATTSPDIITGSNLTCNKGVISGGATSKSNASTVVYTKITSGTANICTTSTCASTNPFGNSTGSKCFDTTKYYNVYGLGVFKGNGLNIFFSKYNNSFTSSLNSYTVTKTLKRLDVVKTAAINFIKSLTPTAGNSPKVRMGLATYNGGPGLDCSISTNQPTCSSDGGSLLTAIGDLDSAKASEIIGKITALTAAGYTPLAETLSDIGAYFALGNTANLTLHPSSKTQTTATPSQIFRNHSLNNLTGNASVSAPILGACQKSSVIILTDGQPTFDRMVSSYFTDYDGDCSGSSATLCGTFDRKNAYAYENYNSSDYLDDVANGLYEMDLRPDLTKISDQKNNITTYTIGFSDSSLDPTSNNYNPLIKDTARLGGGQFVFATDVTTLTDALSNITSNIMSKVGTAASLTPNTAHLQNSTGFFQTQYDSTDWSGDLLMYPIGGSEDINKNGVLDAGEDINKDGVLNAGYIDAQLWNAALSIPNFKTRTMITYNSITHLGSLFDCNNKEIVTLFSIGTSCTSLVDKGIWQLNYIRGDWSHEEINEQIPTGTDTIRSTTAADRIFRNRTHVETVNKITSVIKPDPWLLGDIVHSDPVYVSNENYGFAGYKWPESSTYASYVNSNAIRRKMVYVGANDGIFHGFDANAVSVDAGKEFLAYVPNSIYSKLGALFDSNYSHEYFLDGSPVVSDVYFGGKWHTILVSTTGAGGKGVFALDITDPSAFTEKNVLWEISDADSSIDTDVTTDTSNLRGFQNNMGYTIPKPSIVKMQDGSWVALIANGYGSINQLAVLYVLDIMTGQVLRAIETNNLSNNGLSSPVAVDTNNDGMADVIYAGDLQGQLWKFDTSSTTPSNWKVSNNGGPIFVTTGANQPITVAPEIGPVGATQTSNGSKAGLMLYFGTGKYFEDIDNTFLNPPAQTFYGLWDNNTTIDKNKLTQQSVLLEVASSGNTYRVTSNNSVNYPTQQGWFMDLPTLGERVVSNALYRNGFIIFPSLIPIPSSGSDICGTSASSTGWPMILEAITGSRLIPIASGGGPLDTNADGVINSKDLITVTIGGKAVSVAVSGFKSKIGAIDTPAVINNGQLDILLIAGTNDGAGNGYFIIPATVSPTIDTPISPNLGFTGKREAWSQTRDLSQLNN